MYKLSFKGFINAVAGQVGSNSVYTASHNAFGYLIVTVNTGTTAAIPQYAKILTGTGLTGLVITQPKLTATPNHAITVATSSVITNNATTLTFTCTGYLNWVTGEDVTITGMTPAGYNGTYAITEDFTSNTSFQVSKTLNGANGDPGLGAPTSLGTASMVIESTNLGLYKTNLTTDIGSANLTFTLPNVIPENTQAISLFSGSALLADVMFFNKTTNQLESIALPTQEPYRLDYCSNKVGAAIYASTAVSGTSFTKAIFWAVS